MIARCVSVGDLNIAKEAMLFDSQQHGFQYFGWRLQVKSLYLPQNLLVYQFKFPVKKITFYSYKILYMPHSRLLHRENVVFGNASKIIRNWFLILQPDNYLQFTKVSLRKSMNVT